MLNGCENKLLWHKVLENLINLVKVKGLPQQARTGPSDYR